MTEYWSKNRVYEKARAKGANGKIFYFLDGPHLRARPSGHCLE